MVDPWVFRLMVAGEVAAMLVFHADDIKIAANEEMVEVIVPEPEISQQTSRGGRVVHRRRV